VGCYIWYSEEGPGRAAAQPSLLLSVTPQSPPPNVTAHPSAASVPNTVLLLGLCELKIGYLVTGHKTDDRFTNAVTDIRKFILIN